MSAQKEFDNLTIDSILPVDTKELSKNITGDNGQLADSKNDGELQGDGIHNSTKGAVYLEATPKGSPPDQSHMIQDKENMSNAKRNFCKRKNKSICVLENVNLGSTNTYLKHLSVKRAHFFEYFCSLELIICETSSIGERWRSFPKCVFLIMGNEFCERFSFYAMSVILSLYLINVLELNENQASIFYHSWSFVCSFTPLFGSVLADGVIGKYHTILWVSIFYACGNIITSVASCFPAGASLHPALDYTGLFIIGLGTGGIKPCVSTFGGDQFGPSHKRALDIFFSVFYFTINAGGFLSALITPIIQVQPCMGQDTCYPLAFGIPAVLMLLSVVLFAVGTPLYKRYPAQGTILIQFWKVIWVALKNKAFSKEKRSHWLEYYMDTHDCKTDVFCENLGKCHKATFLKDIHAVLRVLIMFIPVPFFWALYSLMGDRQVYQALTMNGKFVRSNVKIRLFFGLILTDLFQGNFVILPAQIGVVNTVLILTFIPISESLVYPAFSKLCKLTYLRKMSLGGLLCASSYLFCGFLQLKLNTTYPVIPAKGTAFFTVLNYASCNVTVSNVNDSSLSDISVSSMNYSSTVTLDNVLNSNEAFVWKIESACFDPKFMVADVSNEMSTYAVITNDHFGWNYANLQKSTQGDGQFKVSVNYFAENSNVLVENNGVQAAWCVSNVPTTAHDPTGKCTPSSKNADNYVEFGIPLYGGSQFVELIPKPYFLYVKYADDGLYHNTNVTYDQENQGGIYTLTILNGNSTTSNTAFSSEVYQIAPDNSVSIFWTLPQIVILTISEILFSITGLEFSFTQAPKSMKSIMMAVWLLTNAFGQVIVVFVTAVTNFSNVAYLFFTFSILMFFVMIIFILLSIFYYKYV